MKLPIHQKFIDEIKSGYKCWEFRDAHLTLKSIETGEEIIVDVIRSHVIPRKETREMLCEIKDPEFKKMFDDDHQIAFRIMLL